MPIVHFYDKDQLHALMNIGAMLEFDGPRSRQSLGDIVHALREDAGIPDDVLGPKMQEWAAALPQHPETEDWKRVSTLMYDFVWNILKEAGHI